MPERILQCDTVGCVSVAGDIAEFVARCGYIVAVTLMTGDVTEDKVCGIMIGGVITGNAVSLLLLGTVFIKTYRRSHGRCSLSFRRYAAFSFPIMGGSILTAVLSSTNDALIPICLRQYGDSAGKALGEFGVFEGIVIPTLFFPSVVLCSVSGIIVSEAARARAGGNSERIRRMTERLNACTLMFSVFAAAVLMRFGSVIGEQLGGGALAGKMITVIAPVVPFIYMEIVLESLIKGLGLQSFSSVNYLAEYIIRIAAVLLLVPRIGFYGIVISYYASNIIGNSSRFIRIIKASGAKAALLRTVVMPVMLAFSTMSLSELIFRFMGLTEEKMLYSAMFVAVWGVFYCLIFSALGKVKLFSKSEVVLFGDNAQQTVSRVL